MFITQAILEITGGASFEVEDTIETLLWKDEIKARPTDEEINAKIAELQADYDTKQYQRDRVYPSIQEQLDMQYWDSVNGTTTWADAIAAVKAANPKP